MGCILFVVLEVLSGKLGRNLRVSQMEETMKLLFTVLGVLNCLAGLVCLYMGQIDQATFAIAMSILMKLFAMDEE